MFQHFFLLLLYSAFFSGNSVPGDILNLETSSTVSANNENVGKDNLDEIAYFDKKFTQNNVTTKECLGTGTSSTSSTVKTPTGCPSVGISLDGI